MNLAGRYINDRYRVLQKVGEGAMGEVFAAEDIVTDRLVALKVMRKDTEDPASAERFLREAEALARVRSRNVIRIFDFQRDMHLGILFVAMELAIGDDLLRILEFGRLRPGLALAAIEEIASGLASAHEAGIIHRDLKPANLKFRPRSDGSLRVKILDFGLVRDNRSNAALTDVGKAPGTVTYMQPEVLRELQIDSRADLYSLGVIAHEMIAGRPPFRGASPVVTATHHMKTPPPPLEEVVPELLPSGLEELVLAMLEKEPAMRIATAEEVRDRARDIRAAAGLEFSLVHTGSSRDPFEDWDLLPHLCSK